MGVHVLATLDARPVPSRMDTAALTATAPPRVPDPPKPGRRQISVRLLQAYGAEREGVQLHEPKDTP